MPTDPYKYFRPEATELVGQLTSGFLELEKRAGDPAAVLAKLFRVAHTLKGAARIVKHKELAELSHALETWMTPLRDGGTLPERFDEPLAIVDQMTTAVANLATPAPAIPAPKQATERQTISIPIIPMIAVERDDLSEVLDGLADVQVKLQSLRTLDDLRNLPARIDQLDREVRAVREEMEQLQLVPASTLFTPLERVARDAATGGTPVDIVGHGGETRLEASVIALLHGALVQLVRNAIAHGIETPAQRRTAGKAQRARITVDIAQRGGRVFIRVADDGRGIDLAAVRRALDRKGVAAPALSDRDGLMRALLAGGISTADTVTEMAGRGVGLDVARDVARRLGGELSADTVPGLSTTFTLALPLSMSTVRAVVLAGGVHVIAVPLACVREIVRKRPEGMPYASLANVLGGPIHPDGPVAVIDRGAGELIALGAEHVLGVKDVVQRARPRNVLLDPMVAGLFIDDDGLPRAILDAEELAHAVRATRTAPVPTVTRPPPILVIDDSLTTRMLEQSILENAGYQVELASSAEEGLAKAHRSRYALFLVDVEMPGMDGFTFVATTRAHPELGKIPAILVTSRNAPEDLRRGADAGAKGYIVKGEFDQNELLSLIARLV